MNINASPQIHKETLVDNEVNSTEEIQAQIATLDKRMLAIADEDRELQEDIDHTEKNDGSYPQDSQVAGRLRALNNMRDELDEEKGRLLTKKNELLTKKNELPIKETKSNEELDKLYAVSSDESDAFDDALRGTSDGLTGIRHLARG